MYVKAVTDDQDDDDDDAGVVLARTSRTHNANTKEQLNSDL